MPVLEHRYDAEALMAVEECGADADAVVVCVFTDEQVREVPEHLAAAGYAPRFGAHRAHHRQHRPSAPPSNEPDRE